MKNTLGNTVVYTAIIIVILLLSSFTLKQVIKAKEAQPKNSGFVVLELFTSQGCSSCPPADAVLAEYATQNNSNIIPLAFHVDYWNRLGWNDPFSTSEFTQRQSNYATQLNVKGNYTPQIVINGKHELVGSYKNEIAKFVKAELAIKPNFEVIIKNASLVNNQLNIEIKANTIPNSVINLALVKKKELTSIKRGENSGLQQTSCNIVFDFKTLPSASTTASFEFKKEWMSSDYFIVAYLQNNKTGQVLAASKSEIK